MSRKKKDTGNTKIPEKETSEENSVTTETPDTSENNEDVTQEPEASDNELQTQEADACINSDENSTECEADTTEDADDEVDISDEDTTEENAAESDKEEDAEIEGIENKNTEESKNKSSEKNPQRESSDDTEDEDSSTSNFDGEHHDSEPEDSQEDDSEEVDEEEGDALPLINVVEAVIFSARAPLKIQQICKSVGRGTRKDKVEEAIDELNRFYQKSGRAFEIVQISDKYQLMSRPEYARHIQKLLGKKLQENTEKKLSGASLDTLSIIAYKQPITRLEVEAIRGVGCGSIVRGLIERGTIKVVGKKMDVIGQPWLYGTTEEFLKEFGLSSIEELPMINELRQATGSGSIEESKSEMANAETDEEENEAENLESDDDDELSEENNNEEDDDLEDEDGNDSEDDYDEDDEEDDD